MTHPLSLRIAVVGCAALLLVVPVAGAQALSSAEGDTFVADGDYPEPVGPSFWNMGRT